MPKRILLTGFGPFPGVAVNASAILVSRLAGAVQQNWPSSEVRSDVLATEWESGPTRLAKLFDEFGPQVALHFGVSERARGFVIERTARNVRNLQPDACGAGAASACVLEGGADCLASTFPSEAIAAHLRSLGHAAALSDDAGTYLCNTVLYHSLYKAAAGGGAVITGFIHVPTDLGAAQSALSWQQAIDGGIEIVRRCLEEFRQQSACAPH